MKPVFFTFLTLVSLLIPANLFAKDNTLKVTTYNVGLAKTFVPYTEERLSPIIDALKNHDTDVLCLQEVWAKSDQDKIQKEILKNYAYVMKTKIKNYRTGSRPTCRRKEIFGEGKFVSCMQNMCDGKSGDDFTDCIINKCGESLEKLKNTNRTCAQALMAQVGKNPILSIIKLLNPLWRTGVFAYKGSNGLMLFSKYPMTKTRYVDFKDISTLNRRGALQAVLNANGKSLQVLCTHLTADLTATAPYAGIFEGYAEENEEQFSRLLNVANHNLYPTIMLGDFNCGYGDSEKGLSPELERSCQQAEEFGFNDPLSEITRECTFCNENTLNDDATDVAIDHIFTRDLDFLSGKTLFKDLVRLRTKDGAISSNLSDHFGYQVELRY